MTGPTLRRGDHVRTRSGKVYMLGAPAHWGTPLHPLSLSRPWIPAGGTTRRRQTVYSLDAVSFVASRELVAAWQMVERVRRCGRYYTTSGARATDLALAARHLAAAVERGDDAPEHIAAVRAQLERAQTLEVDA